MSRHVRIALKIWPFVIGASLVLALNFFERLLFPVVKDFVITDLSRISNTHVIMSGYMRKVRACDFVGVSAQVDDATGGWVDVPLLFLDNTEDHKATRPTGTQTWGPWRVTVPVQPSNRFLKLESAHSCHPAWTSTTDLVTMAIPPLRPEDVSTTKPSRQD